MSPDFPPPQVVSFTSAAYEAYCGELKAQLEEVKMENEDLKKRLGTTDTDAMELLSAMTGLHIQFSSSGAICCKVLEGTLQGMRCACYILWHHCLPYYRPYIPVDFRPAH
jgi:hypothetical protein